MDNVDQHEITKFNEQSDWWDEYGSYRPLHLLNPLRRAFIEDFVALSGQSVVDIGCGGGILTEAMAKMGASCTGLDLGVNTLKVAHEHAINAGLDIDYQLISAEAFADQHPQSFDIVVCYEMLEHVPDPASIIQACAALVKPQGWVFLSTLNRTPKAYLQAILGAEYVLRILPRGTHDYQKFIKPSELLRVARTQQLMLKKLKGIDYQLRDMSFCLSDKVDVNYLVALQKSD